MRRFKRIMWGVTFQGDYVLDLVLSFSELQAWNVAKGKSNSRTKAQAKKRGWGVCRVREVLTQLPIEDGR